MQHMFATKINLEGSILGHPTVMQLSLTLVPCAGYAAKTFRAPSRWVLHYQNGPCGGIRVGGGRFRNVSVNVSVTARMTTVTSTSIPVDGVRNIEQTKISLASDSACRCQPWLPFLPAQSSNAVKTHQMPTSDAGQGSQTRTYSQIKSLFVLFFCFTQ